MIHMIQRKGFYLALAGIPSLFSYWGIVLATAFIYILALLPPRQAQAIPAFTRLYKTECSSCHTIFPQRNEFGDAFQKNGYVWPGGKPRISKDASNETEPERRWKEVVLQTGLPTLPPLSVQGTSGVTYDKRAEDRTDFKNYEIELMAAGSMRETIGFFINAAVATSEAPGKTELEEAFLIWRQAVKTSVNMRFGRLRPDISLWKANTWLIVSMPATVAPGAGGIDLSEPQSGFELNAILRPRLYASAGTVDRELIDDKSQKEFYGRVSYKIGGADYFGKEPDLDFDKEDVWDFLSVSLGAFAYSGKTLDPADDARHDFYRAGLEAGVLYKRLAFMLGVAKGQNRFTFGPAGKFRAASAEIDYLFTSKLMGLVRYDYSAVEGEASKRHASPALVFAPLQVFKVILSIDREIPDAGNTTGMLSAQFAF